MILHTIFNFEETIRDSYSNVEKPGHFNQGKPERDGHCQLLSFIDRWLLTTLTKSEK